jgi:hypothetical protein
MELDELVSKWEKTGLLGTYPKKESLAMCMEAQVRLNGHAADMPASFRRCSIPIVNRVFGPAGRNVFINHFENNNGKEATMLNVKWNLHGPIENNLETETQYVADFSKNLKEEIDQLFSDRFESQIVFHGLNCDSEGNVILFWS